MSELRQLFRLSQPATSFRIRIRNSYHITPKSAVVLIRGFLENGSEVLPSAGLPFSEKLGGNFKYLPEGTNPEWLEFAHFRFLDPIAAVRVDGVPWGSGDAKSVQWSDIDLRLHHSIMSLTLSDNAAIIGSFEVTPEEVN